MYVMTFSLRERASPVRVGPLPEAGFQVVQIADADKHGDRSTVADDDELNAAALSRRNQFLKPLGGLSDIYFEPAVRQGRGLRR